MNGSHRVLCYHAHVRGKEVFWGKCECGATTVQVDCADDLQDAIRQHARWAVWGHHEEAMA